MKKYLMSQYGIYIAKITDKRGWLTVELTEGLRKDREKYSNIQSEIRKTCEQLYKNQLNIIVG